MSTRVSIFNQNAMQEHFLPETANVDIDIILKKNVFGLDTDKKLHFENVEGKWYICEKNKEKISVENSQMYNFRYGKSGVNMFVQHFQAAGIGYEKFDLSEIEEFSFGKTSKDAFRYSFDKSVEAANHIGCYVSHSHFSIRRENESFVLDNMSPNGVFVDNKFVKSVCKLSYGDTIKAYGLRAVFLGDFIAVDMSDSHLEVNLTMIPKLRRTPEILELNIPEKKFFHRAPRSMPELNAETIDIDSPPPVREAKKQSLLSVLGPSIAMVLPMIFGCILSIYAAKSSGKKSDPLLFTGIITAVVSALFGALKTIGNLKKSKNEIKQEEKKRFESYSQYLKMQASILQEKYDENTGILNDMYPSSEELLAYDNNSPKLWNRNERHKDFLFERLGTGIIPFQVDIRIPKYHFSLNNDSLADKPKRIYESFHELYDVPVGIDLGNDRVIGFIGNGNNEGMNAALRTLILQIVASNCYSEVKLAFAFREDNSSAKSKWGFVRWLPHVWSEDKKARYVAFSEEEASDVFYELTKVFRRRTEEENKKVAAPRPYYILFVDGTDMLEDELICKYIYSTDENASRIGLTTIFMAEQYEKLPNECTLIVENSDEFQGFYHVTDSMKTKTQVQFDVVSVRNMEVFSRKIANIEVNESQVGGEIPSSLSFFDMYGVSNLDEFNVLDRWRKNRNYENMRVLIGNKNGNQPCYLDVHEKYHGPHGLVAGTTGSGKSEVLQTYILSLALNFSPNDVGFFLIDYKGGGMANLFEGLPHLIGSISNLSGNQVRRAMVSIKSENARRQRIFNQHGVNNINSYTRLYKNGETSLPVPHLFIVIDEFAELKREEPEFMRQLISVAQVGRSLGVHLILATQKPSGTVDDNIWSNAKFKLCLRVQDKQDSNDMLHKADAAYLTQAGRCYLQVGNDEIYELFQSGYSGEIYDETAGAGSIELAKMISNSGRAAYVGNLAQKKLKEKLKHEWIVNLINCLEDVKKSDSDNLEMPEYIAGMISRIKEKNLEYEDSEYNKRRLISFLQLYNEAPINKNIDDKATWIVRTSEERNVKLPEVKEKTQLNAVVEYLGKVAKDNGYHYDLKLWMPLLPTLLQLMDIDGYSNDVYTDGKYKDLGDEWSLSAIAGLIDDPDKQQQIPLAVDFGRNGHYMVCGSVSSGKSTFMQTVLYSLTCKYSPEYLNIYAFDFSSRMLSCFEALPHTGGVFYETDVDMIGKCFFMLKGIMEERKELLRGGNYTQYIKANGVKMPAIIVAIDNYSNFRDKTDESFDADVMRIAKEGIGYGIFLLVSSGGIGSNEIPTKLADNFKGTIALELNDKFAYAEVLRNTKIQNLPEVGVKGRGLVAEGDSILEFQTAVCVNAADDYQKLEIIENECKEIAKFWTGKKAKKVPFIPEKPTLDAFYEREEVKNALLDPRRLSLGYDSESAAIFDIDLAYTYSYVISGKARTGKKNTLKMLVDVALKKCSATMQGEVIVIDNKDAKIEALAEKDNLRYIRTDKEIFDFFASMVPIFKERSLKCKEYRNAGLSEKEIFFKMQEYQQYFIFIVDIADFIRRIYEPSEGVGDMSAFMENIFDKGERLNIYFIGSIEPDRYSSLITKKAFASFVKDKWGIHLGGNLVSHKWFTFEESGISFTEQTKAMKAGLGIVPDNYSFIDTKKVVIPKVTQ